MHTCTRVYPPRAFPHPPPPNIYEGIYERVCVGESEEFGDCVLILYFTIRTTLWPVYLYVCSFLWFVKKTIFLKVPITYFAEHNTLNVSRKLCPATFLFLPAKPYYSIYIYLYVGINEVYTTIQLHTNHIRLLFKPLFPGCLETIL